MNKLLAVTTLLFLGSTSTVLADTLIIQNGVGRPLVAPGYVVRPEPTPYPAYNYQWPSDYYGRPHRNTWRYGHWRNRLERERHERWEREKWEREHR